MWLPIAVFPLLILYAAIANIFFRQLLRPLQTLANIVAAIRAEDYSFRARGGRRGDTVGDLTLEINALSGTLQLQRAAAQDALTLLERVLTSMHSPVLAFDSESRLRLLNTAARQTFARGTPNPIVVPPRSFNSNRSSRCRTRGFIRLWKPSSGRLH